MKRQKIYILIIASALFILVIFPSFLTASVSLFQDEDGVTAEYTTEHYDVGFQTMLRDQMAAEILPQTDSAGGWYDASGALTAYYANPGNFEKDSGDYFQFMKLSSPSEVPREQLNEDVLAGKGELTGKAEAFQRASYEQDINEIYLISHALLETGGGTSELAKGVDVGEDKKGKPILVESSNRDKLDNIQTVYNFFGVRANDDEAVKNGAKHAYEEEWYTPEAAISGGATYIKENYISDGQDTLYKMRWDPAHAGQNQYATDVGWAVKQTDNIKRVYDMLRDTDDVVLTFEVPEFKDQPASTERPEGANVFYVDQKSINADKQAQGEVKEKDLQLRTGPTSDFPVEVELSDKTDVTIIGENTDWYKVRKKEHEGWVPTDDIEVKE